MRKSRESGRGSAGGRLELEYLSTELRAADVVDVVDEVDRHVCCMHMANVSTSTMSRNPDRIVWLSLLSSEARVTAGQRIHVHTRKHTKVNAKL